MAGRLLSASYEKGIAQICSSELKLLAMEGYFGDGITVCAVANLKTRLVVFCSWSILTNSKGISWHWTTFRRRADQFVDPHSSGDSYHFFRDCFTSKGILPKYQKLCTYDSNGRLSLQEY